MNDYVLIDFKGNQIFNGEEYFIIEIEHGFIVVHCEDIQNYMYDKYNDERLLTDDYEVLKESLIKYYGIYSERL